MSAGIDYLYGSDILGSSVGADTDAITKTLTTIARIKKASVAEAQLLLSGAQDAINKARAANVNNDGRSATRDEIYWKLKWHENNINNQRDKPNAAYGSIDDLKLWAARAFSEYDVIKTGKAALAANWEMLWADMGKNLADLPQNARDAAGDAVEWFTGIPAWAWVLGGAALFGLLGYGLFKVAVAAAPVAAPALANRYLGAHR